MDSSKSLVENLSYVSQTLEQLEDLDTKDPVFKIEVLKLVTSLQMLQVAKDKLNLFSENEFIEEISTSSIKFMLLDFYQGTVLLQLNSSWEEVQGDRLSLLEKAKVSFLKFIRLCHSYEFTTIQSVKFLKEGLTLNYTREERVQVYKLKKELKQKLQSRKDEGGEEETESLIRELVLTQLELALQDAVEQVNSINQEIKILETVPKGFNPKQGEDGVEDLTWKLDRLAPLSQNLLDAQGRPLRPFVITDQLANLKDQVFRPSWRLPTMSIDEYLQIEKERGNFLQGGGERPTPKQEEDFDNDESGYEAHLKKVRDMDAFKDDNRRGSGNRANKG